METQQKALYNSLRLSWLQEKNLSVESWKVEDLRGVELEKLFQRLSELDLSLDKAVFKSYAEHSESPEELTEELVGELDLLPEEQDQIFLIVFELWRRLIPEKLSISILLDELDHQVYLYDQGELTGDTLETVLLQINEVLEENVDAGIDPEEAFCAISEYAASDIEEFLGDYIAQKIDTKEYDAAEELLEKFTPFMRDPRWFHLLQARLFNVQDEHAASRIIENVFRINNQFDALDLDFEMLSILVQGGNPELFFKVAHHALHLIEEEADFVELLHISADFFRCLDSEEKQRKVEALIQAREGRREVFSLKESAVKEFLALLG